MLLALKRAFWGLGVGLHRVAVVDVAADVGECIADITPVSVTPHPLIQVAGQLGRRHSLHRLECLLYFGPVGFDRLCVGASHRVNEVLAVVHGGVGVVLAICQKK